MGKHLERSQIQFNLTVQLNLAVLIQVKFPLDGNLG